jgi:RNA polymerase sigma factor (TIGR02999 family)
VHLVVLIMPASPDVTQLLADWRAGDPDALDELLPHVYDELRRLARRQLYRRRGRGTMHTTALVHEVYLKLVDQSSVSFDDRSHFLAATAQAMRHVLIDYARRQQALKRGGKAKPVTFHEVWMGDADVPTEVRAASLLDLHGALNRLAELDARQARSVDLKFFGGLTHEEIAAAEDVSVKTVQRDWRKARAWLLHFLSG